MSGDNKNYEYVLRTCDNNRQSHNGFTWPANGHVEAPDWEPTEERGHGLHGLLRGCGDGGLLNWEAGSLWLIVRVFDWIDLGGKVKFHRGEVVFCGDRHTAVALMQLIYQCCPVVGGTATAGNRGTATAGDRGTATAGYSGTATAGNRGTATAGYRGTATAGYRGTATAGDGGVIAIRYHSPIGWRMAISSVGENGIKANVTYGVSYGTFIEA